MTPKTLKSLDALVTAGLVTTHEAPQLQPVADAFSVAVPTQVRNHERTDQPTPALRRQFIPDVRERIQRPEELADPIGDGAHQSVPGIVHRYDNRLLLKIVAICPVYCRFCFRREMLGPGQRATLSDAELETAIDYIASQPQVSEVILTGGDPLILSPRRIEAITKRLASIAHVRKLRWHSRVPILQPHRITDKVVRALSSNDLNVRIAVHCNHADEFSAESRRAIAHLQAAGIQLLSQSVLLKNVNDSADALEGLMKTFSESGIAAYYLHQLDLARGTSHFRVSIRDGLKLMRKVRTRNPALSLPTYMLDLPGGFGKINIESDDLKLVQKTQDHDVYRVRDRHATWHTYRDFCTTRTSVETSQQTALPAAPSTTHFHQPVDSHDLS